MDNLLTVCFKTVNRNTRVVVPQLNAARDVADSAHAPLGVVANTASRRWRADSGAHTRDAVRRAGARSDKTGRNLHCTPCVCAAGGSATKEG
jgi:hypothetical protein